MFGACAVRYCFVDAELESWIDCFGFPEGFPL